MNVPLSSIEGVIEIVLSRGADGGCVPTITSTRPFNLPRTFVGKSAKGVAASIGLLFSLCGQAQRAASLGAIEAAMGHEVSDLVLKTRAQAVQAETLREWVLGSNPEFGPDMRDIVRQSQVIMTAAKPAFEFGGREPLVDLGEKVKTLDAMAKPRIANRPAPADGHGVAELTPADLAGADLLPRAAHDSGLAENPTIDGLPRWTQGRAPSAASPLYVYRDGRPRAGHGWGLACVPTARGLLTHAVRLSQGTIAAYRITAPTEWNFHPQGIAAQLLRALPIGADWLAEARRIVDAIDPCVQSHIRLQEVPDA
jgi:coenzyme F420-reducing hydrogenase alpha subunit